MSRQPLAGVESGIWWAAIAVLAVERGVRRLIRRPARRAGARHRARS